MALLFVSDKAKFRRDNWPIDPWIPTPLHETCKSDQKFDGILQLENCKGLHDCMYGKTAVRQNKCNFQFLIFDLRTYILKRFVRRLIDDVSLSYPSFRKKVLVIYILVQKDFWHSVFRKFPTICHWGFAKVLSMSKDHFWLSAQSRCSLEAILSTLWLLWCEL